LVVPHTINLQREVNTMEDQYIITLKLITGGPPETISFSEYGQAGLSNAVLTVDWDVKNRHAYSGTINRVLPSGACIQVYERGAS